ncbi:MAG: hypothetical protein AB9866_18860 [Syntrophobacteraceae bacterium]
MTLLEKAKKQKCCFKKITATDEEIELAIAWIKGEVTFSQVKSVLDFSQSMSAYIRMAIALRTAYQKNIIKI